jgi:tetratricopeptide (TPR) repeat protein
MSRLVLCCLFLFLMLGLRPAFAAPYDEALGQLQQQWATIKYQMPDHDQQRDEIRTLKHQANELSRAYPNKAEPLIWQAIIVATKAEIDRNYGSLLLIQQARDLLIEANKINPRALHGLGAANLGSLYCEAPKPPLSFGDMDLAKEYLERAVTLNPRGLDTNYFYGKCLHEMGEDVKAKAVLTKALAAPVQANNGIADEGRRAEIQETMDQLDTPD